MYLFGVFRACIQYVLEPENSLVFFRPVFNIADSAITVGVSIILIWQKRFFAEPILPEKNAQEEKVSAAE